MVTAIDRETRAWAVLEHRAEWVDALRKVPILAGLETGQLNRIAGEVEKRKAGAGAVLAHQGRREREFIVILDGTARVERDGKVLAHLRAGDFCGELALIDGGPRSATVVAESPSVLLVMKRGTFVRLLDSAPDLRKKILVTLCQRLRDADATLAALN